jgi:hypothetical protein
MLQSFLQTMDVKPVGVVEQPVAFTGGSPWEAIKGYEAGSSRPIRRLTEIGSSLPDESVSRSDRVSPHVGDTSDLQNDLAYSAPGQQGDLALNLRLVEL